MVKESGTIPSPLTRAIYVHLKLNRAAWVSGLAVILVASLLKQWPNFYTSLQRLERSLLPPQTHPLPRPDHCRPDLPGCVPLQIDNIFFLHIPKIHAPSGRNSSYTFKSCDVGRLGLVHSACPARRGWLRNVVEYAQVCAAQADALQNSEWSNPYLAFDCSTLSGHYDLQAFKYMDEATRKRTLVIASLREPRDLVVSLFNFLPLAQRRYCVADVSEVRGDQHHCSLASKHFDAEITLGDFVRGEAGLGIDLQGGMIKMIAGDYCCWNSDAPLMGSKQRLESAIAELENTVGVVLLKERMSESLRYLAYVLGWPTDIDTNIVINVSPHGSWASAPREVQHALTSVTRQDRVLYSYAERRLNEQLRSMKFNSK